MKLSKWTIGAALAAVIGAVAGPASAQGGNTVGCWSSGSSPNAQVCFGRGGNGVFLLIWDAGRCGGNAYINDNYRSEVRWEVPRQANACYQNGEPERLARREYTCNIRNQTMYCREVILLDNGEVWKEKDNVQFRAQ